MFTNYKKSKLIELGADRWLAADIAVCQSLINNMSTGYSVCTEDIVYQII